MKQITWHNNHNEHDENSTQRERARDGERESERELHAVIDKYAKAGNERGQVGVKHTRKY